MSTKNKKTKLRILNNPPVFNPEKWKYAINAGCYPYAINLFYNKFALVGDFIGKRCSEKVSDKILIETLKKELKFLGYDVKETNAQYSVKEDEIKIYIQRDEHTGYYHFLRQDKSGIWSHKFPNELPTNLDSYGQVIEDPEEMVESAFYGWYFLLKRTS